MSNMDGIKELKKIRKERGLSYERMARELGVSWRTLYRWIQNENAPSLLATEKIAAYLSEVRASRENAKKEA
jgi:transcriptional regulator with XRE-family HTH domain